MDAIDTNVLVRCLIEDNPAQSRKARALIGNRDIFVSVTVLLESEWVLRSLYGQSNNEIYRAFRAFAGLPRIKIENPILVAEALDRAQAGMDFADALHLGAAAQCEALFTFDRKFVKAASAAHPTVKEP